MMETESFYGVTLDEKEKLSQFEVNETEQLVGQKLIIKQILLGAAAKDAEFNVVQAEVKGNEKETLKIPIAVLKAGETRTLRPNIEFPSTSVTFKLIQGSGPVHIIGQHVFSEQYNEFYQHGEEEEEVDDDDDDDLPPQPQTNGKNSNKRK